MSVTHSEMVKQLAKSGADIVEDLTPSSAHLLHMAIGVAGEAGEILLAVIDCENFDSVNIENIVEELGDIEFYLEGYRQEMGFKREITIDYGDIDFTMHGKSFLAVQFDAARLCAESSNLLDIAKKIAIYTKDVNSYNTLESLKSIEIFLESIRQHFGITHEGCIEHNVEKLHSGKNARYKEGSFSNKQANERADKK